MSERESYMIDFFIYVITKESTKVFIGRRDRSI